MKNTTPSIVACLVIYCTCCRAAVSLTPHDGYYDAVNESGWRIGASQRRRSVAPNRLAPVDRTLVRSQLLINEAAGFAGRSRSRCDRWPWATCAIANFLVRKRYTRINYYRTHISLAWLNVVYTYPRAWRVSQSTTTRITEWSTGREERACVWSFEFLREIRQGKFTRIR